MTYLIRTIFITMVGAGGYILGAGHPDPAPVNLLLGLILLLLGTVMLLSKDEE